MAPASEKRHRSATAGRRPQAQEPWRCDGHRYTVVLRGLDRRQCEAGQVDDNIGRVEQEGFVNFFELANFGLAEVPRHEVGAALWTGQWDRAAKLLLTTSRGEGDTPGAGAADAFLEGDLARGLELLPEKGAEGLRALALQLLMGQPAHQALCKTVPAAIWARHLSAVSRIAWNHAVAARLAELPRRPLPGDLTWDERQGVVRPLVATEVDSRQLSDVVLPLPRPGTPVLECRGRLRMESVLQRLVPLPDAPVEDFPMNVATLLPQARRIVSMPSDVTWDLVEAGPEPVVECDLARVGVDLSTLLPETDLEASGKTDSEASGTSRTVGGRRSMRAGASRGGSGGGRGPAVRLRFTLHRGENAEAILREVLRAEPSDFVEGLGRRDEFF